MPIDDPTANMGPDARKAYLGAQESIARCLKKKEEMLSMGAKGLTEIPPEIGQLTFLTRLDLRDNQLSSLPAEIGKLTALTELYLMGNRLDGLPADIGKLRALTDLDLSRNKLRRLPAEIGRLTALTALDLTGNRLTSLPRDIVKLRSLVHLDLHENRLGKLPQGIEKLQSLLFLNLRNNQLKALPKALRQLQSLQRLYLHGNPELELSSTVLGPEQDWNLEPASPASILDFYFSRLSARARPLNEVKLILVGRGGVGKTTILAALRGEKFREGEESTPGIALSDWVMDGEKGRQITAHAWDFAGQIITHALHQFFFSVRTLYVLVLTGRENNERSDAEYWLRLIKAFGSENGEGPPVVVTLNKWETPDRPRVDREALRESYPFIRAFVETDCKNGYGIPALRAALHQAVLDSPWVQEPFAENWDDVRRALVASRESKSHMSFDEYRRLCTAHGVTDPGVQDSLSEILHRLGIVLNYRRDLRLREATVLQPHWLTENVYGLIRRAEDEDGILTQAHVNETLRAEPDRNMRDYLVRIMERFEIAYAARAGGKIFWLVPQALPDHQPPGLQIFRDAPEDQATRLRYSYAAMPEGLVPRAMVRLHELIEQDAQGHGQQWASGAVLAREGARALLRAEPGNKVMITVLGPPKARQQLAGLCQAEMRDVHRDIPGLNPLEETQVEGQWVPTATLEHDEKNHQKTGIQTLDRGTVLIDPAVANDAYSVKEAREDDLWKPRVFISYSKSNVNQRRSLEIQLKILRNEGLLASAWHDRMVDPGDAWNTTIQHELEEADVILILVSAEALATDYITDVEIPLALKLRETKGTAVVPIILEAISWHRTALGKLQALPEKGKPLNEWNPRARGWKSVADGLTGLCNKRIKNKPSPRGIG